MRIDGFSNQNINIEPKCDKGGAAVNGAMLSDIVSFGSSNDTILGKEVEKNSFLNGEDGTLESMRDQAKILKQSLSAVFNKMDTGAVVKMDEEGIDVNDMEPDKIVTVVEEIQIKLAMYCDDFQATVDIDAADIENTIGRGVNAYKIANAFAQNNVKLSDDNVREAMDAIDKASSVSEVTEEMKAFILQNNMKPSINNIYVAAHAGYVSATSKLTDSDWNELLPQVDRLIEEAGLPVNQENRDNGRWMLDNQIEITADNFVKLDALSYANEVLAGDEIFDRIAAAMTEGLKASDALVTGEALPWENAVNAVEVLDAATDGNIMQLVVQDIPYTIDSLAKIQEDGLETTPDRSNTKYIKAHREILEARLMMTVEAAHIMEKNGISVNTTDITELLEKLKEYEADILSEGVKNSGKKLASIDIEQVSMVMVAVDGIKALPSAVIGSVIEAGEEPTVNNFSLHGAAVIRKVSVAAEAYEALSTEIRSDLGDSVSKAVKASTTDILSDMGYEDNEANRRAVRILAYNDMEINEANVDKVKNIDYSVNELFANMTPKKVLEMIREGVNPLDANVTELNKYFTKEETAERSVEKYSEFLYRMEKNNSITADEREKYIGVFGLVRRIQKDGMNSIGSLVNQGLEVTMGNLLTAYMSRFGKGMELTVDDVTEQKVVSDKISYLRNLLAGARDKITPDSLAKLGETMDDMSVEKFVDAINQSEVVYENDPVYVKYVETAQNMANLDDSIYKFVSDNNIPATFNNLLAAKTLVESPRDIFGPVKEKNEDVEAEIMASIESKEQAVDKYEEIYNKAKEVINQSLFSEDSYIDMESMRLLGNNLRLLSNMAKQNNYQIPYEKDGEIGIINLKVLENGENSGVFHISTADVTIEGKVDSQGIFAQITGTEEAVNTFNAKKDDIAEGLKQLGLEEIRLFANRADVRPSGSFSVKDGVKTELIFRAAKIFIMEIAK